MSYVKDDGSRLSTLGEYCRSIGTQCSTWVIVREGGRLRKYVTGTPCASTCPSLSAVVREGSRLKVTSASGTCVCG